MLFHNFILTMAGGVVVVVVVVVVVSARLHATLNPKILLYP